MKTTDKLRWIELRDPIKQWSNPEVQDLFGQVLSVKILGYRPHYADGVVPVDTTDFFGNHYLIARESDNRLDRRFEVISGFREVTLSLAQRHYAPFPLVSLAKSTGSAPHIEAAQRMVNEALTRGSDLAYHASFTVHPKHRTDRSVAGLMIEHMHSMMHFIMERAGFELPVSIAVVDRFNPKISYDAQGFCPMTQGNGSPLPSIRSPFLAGEPITFMSTQRLNSKMTERAEAHRTLWDNRWVIDGMDERIQKDAA